MSYADKVFKETVRDILENGTDTQGELVRPHWADGTPAYTIKKFGVVNRYDLRKEFPALTLRHIGLKSAMDEILWIYQKKSNDIHELNSSIWDEWADERGLIGKAYGYQMGVKHAYKDVTIDGLWKAFQGQFISPGNTTYFEEIPKNGRPSKRSFGDIIAFRENKIYPYDERNEIWQMDQMDKVIYDLKNTPFSRRIMTTTWNPEDQFEMALAPCAYSMTYNVTDDHREDGKLTLNAVLNQRSQDMLAANGWNTAQYAILLMMVAQTVGMVAGELVHVIADCHIYDRHIPMIKTLLDREEFPAPKVSLNPEIKDFYQFTTDDLIIEDYVYGEQIKNIPVAE